MSQDLTNRAANWTEVSRERIYDGYRKVDVVTYRTPDGQERKFDIKAEGNPVCILALTPDNQVILAEQFRPGPGAVLLELPGGGMEKGETPEEAAVRELLEETGYRGDVQLITQCLECGYSTIDRFCFVATNCVKVADQKLDDGEFVEMVLMDLSEFRQHLKTGRLTDPEVGYLGLDHLGLL